MSTPLIEKMSRDLNMLKLMFPQNAGAHNSICRGEDITDLWYDGTVSEDIANGTFANEFVGDYIVGKSSGKKYYVADLNYWKNTGKTLVTTNHIVIIPASYLGSSKQMNTSDTTEGAYLGSEMYTTNLEDAKTIIKNDFEENHLLTHSEIFSSAVTGGYESEYTIIDSTIDLMNECMVFGSNIYHNSLNGTVEANNRVIDNSQLAIFRYRHDLIKIPLDSNRGWWLRDVTNSSNFAQVNLSGYSLSVQASSLHWVRPAFAII